MTVVTNLTQAELEKEYTIRLIKTDDSAMEDFLFTLGVYMGEKITVLSQVSGTYVVVVKSARYSIDGELAQCIVI